MAAQIVISDDIQALCDAISEMPSGIVVFDGFQGAGKSTQAQIVARELGCAYIDVDGYFGVVRPDPQASHDDLVRSGMSKLKEVIRDKLKAHRLVLVSTIRAREVIKLLKVKGTSVRYVYVESYLDTPILKHEVIEYHIATNPKKKADIIYRRKAVDEIEAMDRITGFLNDP